MDDYTRTFSLDKTRSAKGRIVDAVGHLGNWPFRRTISYHIGVNCDTIEARDGHLYVLRRGRTIARAELPREPLTLRRLLRSSLDGLLHPRHAARDACGREISLEDLIRPRRSK